MLRVLSVLYGQQAWLYHLEGSTGQFSFAFPPEMFPTVEEAVQRTLQAGDSRPLVTVVQCPSDLGFWGAPISSVGQEEVVAQFHEADRLMVARMPSDDLARLPEGPVLAEDSVLVKALTGRYRGLMKGVWYHLDLSSSRIVLFVYKGGQLLGMFPSVAGATEDEYLAELQGVFLDAGNKFANEPAVQIVVSGESGFQRFQGNPKNWMTPVMLGKAEAGLFDEEGETFNETPHLNILLYGAVQAYLDYHGADFRNEFGISKGQNRPKPKAVLSSMASFLPQMPTIPSEARRAFTIVGLVAGLLIALLGIGLLEFQIQSRQRDLARRERREMDRAVVNQGIEEYDRKVRAALKNLQDRIETINGLRAQQDIAYLICEEILLKRRPEEVQITRLTIEDRHVKIEGYVSYDTVLKPPLTQTPKERKAMVTESLSGVSLEDYYAQFLTNIEQSNGTFVNVQPSYESKTGRAEFTIEANFVKNGPDGRPLLAKSLEGQPVPLVLQIKEGK